MSADRMEADGEIEPGVLVASSSSNASRIPVSGWRAYTEQLVRLEGQGIWYDPIVVPPASRVSTRDRLGIAQDAVVLACPQSSFKLNPWLDDVLVATLRSVPNAILVLVHARRPAWTRATHRRLLESGGSSIADRIRWVPRQATGDQFLELLQAADVLVHPFPFGGSKTAADAIAAGVPVVALVTRHLRCRMARSLLLSAGADDLIATSPLHMVRLASKLLREPELR